MADFFRAYKAQATHVPTFFIESTAPNNVDDEIPSNASPVPPELIQVDADAAIGEIAEALSTGADPNLVVMVHGFNNARDRVLDMYRDAAVAIQQDAEIQAHRSGLVCIGYRWPSERMLQPWKDFWRALPRLPAGLFAVGLAMLIVSWTLYAERGEWVAWLAHALAISGIALAGLIAVAFLLRVIVYFRDQYRATNYGIPDLTHVIRTIDAAVAERHARRQMPQRRGHLSFIGHSMGGFVVTNTIRALVDATDESSSSIETFGRRSFEQQTHARGSEEEFPRSHVGKTFRLMRFVLASPDIPAEHLLSSRSNFLASALVRFTEAFLFSNEGDEVLRQISTTANYFSFPAKTRAHGFRLGNVEILASGYGFIRMNANDIPARLRVGDLTIRELEGRMEAAAQKRAAAAMQLGDLPNPSAGPPGVHTEAPLPKRFTYFDCTDYVDRDGSGRLRGLLTFAKRWKANNPVARLPWYAHLSLLLGYLRGRVNVHGGYFDGAFGKEMTLRLACLGFRGAVNAYGDATAMSQACAAKQVRVLVSPELAGVVQPAAGRIPLM